MASIAFADVLNHAPLPIDSQDIITRVRLVVAGNRAGPEPDLEFFSDLSLGRRDHFPEPVVYEYEAPEHATYGCERSFALPEGISPFLDPTDSLIPEPTVIGITNPGDPSAVRDGDPDTYAELSGWTQARIRYSLGDSSWAYRVVGFRLRYALTGDSGAFQRAANQSALIQQWHYTPPPDAEERLVAARRYYLKETGDLDDAQDIDVVTMWDARGAVENRSEDLVKAAVISTQIAPFASANWRVHHFYPLILNETLLEGIAKANVRLPASAPQRVTVKGYVAPEAEHTIVGWPGGDYTGVVAQHQYEIDRTIIDFEQAGSPIGLPAEAIEAARAQRVATQSVVDTAGYGLKMGERQ